MSDSQSNNEKMPPENVKSSSSTTSDTGEFEAIKGNVLSPDHWIRLFFMILFGFVLQVASLVVGVVVVLQFLFALLTGSDNENLRSFGASLTRYIADTLKFLTYNSEDKPFPFADWPFPDEPKD
ncbi:DUF4389 domain-containing protein [Simiduia aestuariiviva]|uniref:DUF4389 domain-containing protein n=1 Tax=Simiduia aestuariiviva TaxID=1510459 RepID=A0A839UKJ0_9GAMM|nr:DUF4389 domain-containing protein [Simiduia aestuariiviva]MBB3168634.1 hypothetical protein [Simiduia aestuariiviva]